MKFPPLPLLTAFVLAVSPLSSRAADILVQYSFPGFAPTATADPAQLTASDLARVPFANPKGIFRFDTSKGMALSVTSAEQKEWDFQTAFDHERHFGFTVTPTAGKSLNLDSLTFKAGGNTAALRGFYVLSSVGGFDGQHILSSAHTDRGGLKNHFQNFTVDLPEAEFHRLTVPVTFRIYVQTSGTNANINFDDITLTGTVSP